MTRTEAPEKMTLQEIREAYAEILRAYNAIFPVHPETRIKFEDETEGLDRGDQNFLDTFRMKAKKIVPKLREAADQSGNVKVWHRGNPLEGLNQGMKERVEKALNLGT
jgi:hypothetical protein